MTRDEIKIREDVVARAKARAEKASEATKRARQALGFAISALEAAVSREALEYARYERAGARLDLAREEPES